MFCRKGFVYFNLPSDVFEFAKDTIGAGKITIVHAF